ncbi:MAG: Hpt domain-containing protein [Burkholderiales bacterium]|nr:Hpt domain-containing protein [Burkholderiales bacterium]
MAAAVANTFDVGPLSWVKTEIDHSLNEARQHLDKVAADPADAKSLKFVQTHLHQVTGALSMVGLGTAAHFNEEIEKTVGLLAEPGASAGAVIVTAKKGMSALSGYLDSLLAGSPNRPMSLAPAYVELAKTRGAPDVSESNLFFPDLSVSMAAPEDTVVVPTKEMLEHSLKQKRATFQAGLLKLLRDRDFDNGVRLMKEAVLGVESLQLHSPSRTFWFAASGFLDAVALGGNDQRSVAVALFGKIDQQIKLLQEGTQKVPERLFRDLLLVVGRSSATSDRIRQIRSLFSLDDLLARDEHGRSDAASEVTKGLLKQLRDLTAQQKDTWLKFTSGNRTFIDAFVKQAEVLMQGAVKLGNNDFAIIYRALGSVGANLRSSAATASEVVALEVATALLFLENSLENYFRLGPEFTAQARGVAGRVSSALSGASLPVLDPAAAGLMDDMSRRAQERLLIFQVGQEVQVNLQQIEQVLDGYFRDPLKASELKPLAALFNQVQGALAILDLNEAAALNQLITRRVAEYASGARKGEGEDAEGVAEGVSALGLYIGALQQGTAQPIEALMPALIRFGLAEKPAEPKQSEKSSVSQADIEEQKQKAQELYQEWKSQPGATEARDQLKQAVEDIKRDAEIVADKATIEQSTQALSLLETAADPTKTGLHEALSIIAPATATAAPEPSAQAVQLLDKESAEVDAELLEIFLEEAGEVVATIHEHLSVVKAAPGDKEALTTIRRSFHTLKGSGRMVGLTDLGEVAWQAEQVMNKWLKEEKPASSSLMRFIELAAQSFEGWVGELKAKGHAAIDGSVISGIADAIKSDREPAFPGEASTATESPTDEVAASLTLPAPGESAMAIAADAGDQTAASAQLAAVAEPVVLSQPAIPEDHIAIGDMVVFAPLFDIYIEEAQDHLATLQRESALLESAPDAPVSHEFMRAAHTLTGSSNTTGIEVVSQLAHALESWAKSAIEFPAVQSATALTVVRQAVDALGHMVEALKAQQAPLQRPDLAAELDQLRDQHVAAQRPGEDTLVRTGRFYGLQPEQVAEETKSAPAHTEEAPPPIPLEPDATIPAFNFEPEAGTAAPAEASEVVAPPLPPSEAQAGQLDVAAFDFLKTAVPEVERQGDQPVAVAPLADLPFDLPVSDAAPAVAAPVEPAAEISFEVPNLDLEAPAPAEASPVSDGAPDFAFLDTPAPSAEPAEQVEAPTAVVQEDDVSAFFAEPDVAAAPTPEPAIELPVQQPPAEAAPEPAVEIDAEAAFFAESEALPEPSPEAETVAELPADLQPPPIPDSVAAAALPVEAPEAPVEEGPAIDAASVAAAGAVALGGAAAAAFAAATPELRAAAPIDSLAIAAEPVVVEEAAPAVFEAGKEKRRIQDDIDTDLLPIFLEEAKEIVPSVGDSLRAWKGTPTDHSPVVELARHLHTLKGSARMAGLMRLGELAHIIETHVIEMDKDSAPATQRFERFEEYWDRFTTSIDRLESGEDLPTAIEVPITDLFEHQKDKPGAIAVMAAAAAAVREEVQIEGRERQALLRVNADLIDRFVNEAGELAITRSRVDGEMITFKRSMAELAENVTRMRTQLREIEIEAETAMSSRIKERDEHSETFDPLEFDRFSRMQEVTRFLAESLYDVVTLQQSLQKNLDEVEAALTHQGRLNRDLQQGLMGVRLVPLGNLQDRLYRIVRQTAKELNKKANLEFRGARVELDRSVLEKITAPFEHLLRNAIAHGLETPDRRLDAGKAEIGEISIDANQVGNEVVLTVRDDGAGLNYPRIRARAIEAGLMQATDDLPDDQLAQFIFQAGFSTASEVTAISGRGVGMDVVKNEIVSLGGRIEMSSISGKGTTFVITLPLTLAVTQAVMVRVGDAMYAIPSVMVEQVQEYKGKKYDAMLTMTDIDWKGNRYPYRSLEALLGGAPQQSVLKRAYAILAKSGQQRAAVQVDEIIGNREVVVKQIGPQLARLPGVSGATVLGNGQVLLILNPVHLVFREAIGAAVAVESASGDAAAAPAVQEPAPTVLAPSPLVIEAAGPDAPAPAMVPAAPTVPLVMVVDDSLTVRKITSRMLTREGYEVATAKDGVDGLKQLQDIMPSIILLDIEMPRMDGFEFARNVRADAKAGKIPIIMITSRTADKHRNHAMEIGVNEYMGKPYQEDQLLTLIRQYVGLARAASN